MRFDLEKSNVMQMYYLCQEDDVFTHVCLLVNWHYTKTTKQIFTKLGWRMGLRPLSFAADVDKGMAPEIYSCKPYNIFQYISRYTIKQIKCSCDVHKY